MFSWLLRLRTLNHPLTNNITAFENKNPTNLHLKFISVCNSKNRCQGPCCLSYFIFHVSVDSLIISANAQWAQLFWLRACIIQVRTYWCPPSPLFWSTDSVRVRQLPGALVVCTYDDVSMVHWLNEVEERSLTQALDLCTRQSQKMMALHRSKTT